MRIGQIKRVFLLVGLFGFLLWGSGCCTGRGEKAGEGGSGTTDDVSVTALKNLPLDLDDADTTNASFSALPGLSVKSSVSDGNSVAGQTSEAGCMCTGFFKPLSISQMLQAKGLVCYLEKIQADEANSITMPTDSYSYYLVDTGNGENGPSEIRVRTGNFSSGDSKNFKMQVCESSDGTTFLQTLDLQVGGATATKTWSGFMTNHFNQDGEASYNNTAFSVVMKTAEAMSEEFSISNVSTLTTESTFGRDPSTASSNTVTSETTYSDGFQLTFGYDAVSSTTGGPLNTVIGSFSSPGSSVTGIMSCQFNSSVGAAQMNYNAPDSTFDFNSSEAFSLSSSTPVVVNESDSSVSALYNIVEAENLSSQILSVPNEVNSVVGYTNSWDCLDGSGGTSGFTTLDISGIDFSACEAVFTEAVAGLQKSAGGCFSVGGSGGGGIGNSLTNPLPNKWTFEQTGRSLNCTPTNMTLVRNLITKKYTLVSDAQMAATVSASTTLELGGEKVTTTTLTKSNDQYTDTSTGNNTTTQNCTFSTVPRQLVSFTKTSCSSVSSTTTRSKVSGDCSTVLCPDQSDLVESFTATCTVTE